MGTDKVKAGLSSQLQRVSSQLLVGVGKGGSSFLPIDSIQVWARFWARMICQLPKHQSLRAERLLLMTVMPR